MKKDKVVVFDKLDGKLIAEMPLISEVLTSTMNKISRQFEPYYEELAGLLGIELEKHKYWGIKIKERNVFFPFISENSSRKGITQLENDFLVYNHFECVKRIRGKRKNMFHVECGYCCRREEGEPSINCFFFGVRKEYEPDKYEGLLFDTKFYERLKRNVLHFECVVWNPEEQETEGIELRCNEVNETAINLAFSQFKVGILKPFLKHLKYQ